MNIEYRRKVFVYFTKKTESKEPPFEILLFDILPFCGSLFRSGDVSYKETMAHHESTPVKYDEAFHGAGEGWKTRKKKDPLARSAFSGTQAAKSG